MADGRSLNSDKIIEDLRRQILDLKYNNDQLSAKVKKWKLLVDDHHNCFHYIGELVNNVDVHKNS